MQRSSIVGKAEVNPLLAETRPLSCPRLHSCLEFQQCWSYTYDSSPSVMPDVNRFQAQVRFGAYHVDLRTGELRKHGQKVRLAGRPFQILAMLLEQPGELLTRKELQ